jgi:metal-dependent amidase/aminoacylase/carboxypeptidase family protein
MTALVERAARSLLGDERVHVIDRPTITTEDFGYFLMEKPGSFYHVGAGCPLPLHNTAFLPDEQAPVIAAAVHAAVIGEFLANSQ